MDETVAGHLGIYGPALCLRATEAARWRSIVVPLPLCIIEFRPSRNDVESPRQASHQPPCGPRTPNEPFVLKETVQTLIDDLTAGTYPWNPSKLDPPEEGF
ncbi:hypothetical protein ISCGN_009375 [Ixodes scapularis]